MIVPSKINLFLQVKGVRPDSYHELDMVFYPLTDPADELELVPSSDGNSIVECDTAGVPPDPRKNLCGKALSTYFRFADQLERQFVIKLKKRIPVAAGMGGGSSDAAAVLLLLQQKFGYLSRAQLKDAALSIGADVPFFLDPVCSRAQGIGEQLSPIRDAMKDLHIRLYSPGFPVSAKWSYTHALPPDPDDPANIDELISGLRTGDTERIARNIKNDLGAAVMEKFPLLKMAERAMSDDGALRVMVSGSGPVLFGIYAKKPESLWFHLPEEKSDD